MHLFTLATMVFILQLIVNTITVKISVGFFRFPSNLKEFKKWEHLNRLNSLNDTNVIAIVNKTSVNRTVRTCHLTNELVPLNGRTVETEVANKKSHVSVVSFQVIPPSMTSVIFQGH